MIAIRPATLRDMTFIAANMRQPDYDEITAAVAIFDRTALGAAMFAASPAYRFCAFIKDEPVCAFGVATDANMPHAGVAWAYGTRRMRRAVPEMTRFGLSVLVPQMMADGLHRVECRSIIGHDLSHRWLEGLGAVREGIARGYGRGGEDFVTYAWVVPKE